MNAIVPAKTRPLHASIELLPKQVPSVDTLKSLLPAGIRVYLTDLGTADTDHEMLLAARRLYDAGCRPVPHLAARRLKSRDRLEERLAALTQDAGVSDVLVIGGGVNPPAGPFASSMDLLQTGLLDRFGIADIGVAGHPEGSPDFSDAMATEALLQKQSFAHLTNARLRIVTQFGFDPAKTLTWAESLRKAGVDTPLHLGVAGPAKLTTLIKYATLCGVGNSLSMLTKRAGGMMALATGYAPDTFVKPVENALSTGRAPLISQMHVFPFGGLNGAAHWLRDRGSW